MSDRRPTQRSNSSAARRPASAGAQPSGARPGGGSGSRRQAPRGKRRVNGRFYVFLAILAVVIVAIVLLIWRPWAQPSDSTVQQPSAQETVAPADASGDSSTAAATGDTALTELLASGATAATATDADSQVTVTDLSINPDLSSEWTNILLLGVDQRMKDEFSRSDTMIICSINAQTSEVKLTSLMRDTAVDYEAMGIHDGVERLNAANAYGGPNLVMKTVNELLDMNIEGYVLVNFTGFTQICEGLGGIEMDITQEEMEQINHNAWSQYQIALENGWDESNLESTNVELTEYGENVHLNGRQALAYARIRKIDSDFERTNRQRKVLVAMLDKMRGTTALELMQLGMSLQQYMETNMTLSEIVSIAERVLNSDFDANAIETLVLPQTGTYVQETRDGMSMFYDVNWTANTLALHDFIYY